MFVYHGWRREVNREPVGLAKTNRISRKLVRADRHLP